MFRLRKSEERGHADHGWLDTWHTFSFDQYYDPEHIGFRALRVINEDRVKGGMGFPMHAHRDMEIVTIVLEGALEHRDSLGNGSVIRPGDVQRMSAGTGIRHSEFNHSKTDSVHLLQIWILPEQRGLDPGYEQIHFESDEKKNRLRIIASPDGREGSVTIRQDVSLYVARIQPDLELDHVSAPGRHAWIQVARGSLTLNGSALVAGDGAAISDETDIHLRSVEDSEVLLFDLA